MHVFVSVCVRLCVLVCVCNDKNTLCFCGVCDGALCVYTVRRVCNTVGDLSHSFADPVPRQPDCCAQGRAVSPAESLQAQPVRVAHKRRCMRCARGRYVIEKDESREDKSTFISLRIKTKGKRGPGFRG
jgi:hypothetical protein